MPGWAGCPESIAAVSYTHLDVYKRQLEGDDVYDDMILTANCFVTSIDNYEDIAAYLKGSGKVTFCLLYTSRCV